MPPADATFANQKQAAEILTLISRDQPDHPGIVHYLIHAFDSPRLARAEGRNDEAWLTLAPPELEEKVGTHPVTPGAVLPARALLGDLLLELNRPDEALRAFERSLMESPNRFNSLAGAARAAARAGQRDKAGEFYRTLLTQADDESRRPEVRDARAFLDRSSARKRGRLPPDLDHSAIHVTRFIRLCSA